MGFDPFDEKSARDITTKICKGKSHALFQKTFDKVIAAQMTIENLSPGGIDSRLGEQCLALAEIVATGRGNGSRKVVLPIVVEKWLTEKKPTLDEDLAKSAQTAINKVRKNSAASAIAEEMGGWPEWTSYCRGLSSRLGKPSKVQKKATTATTTSTDPIRLLRDKGCDFKIENGTAVELRITEKDVLIGEDLKLIASIKSLKFLMLNNQPIQDADLAMLSPLKQLRTLLINCNTLKGPGFNDLQLKSLQSIGISRKNANKVVASCGHLLGLKSFDLRSTDITDKGLEPLAGLPSLKAIDIGHCERMKGTGFKAFSEGTKLESIAAGWVQFSRAGWNALLALAKLKHLRLASAKIPSGGVQRLVELKQLQTLDLGKQNLSDDDVLFLGELRRLRCLSLSGNKAITDRTVELLSKLPLLEKLDLAYTAISGKAEAMLAKMAKLKDVSVFSTGVSRAAEKRLDNICRNRG